MKVCLISGVFPPRISGPSTQTYQLALLLSKHGVHVIVITFGDSNQCKNVEGVKVYYLKEFRNSKKYIRMAKKFLNAALQMIAIFKKEKPDVVHHQTGVDYFSILTAFLTGLFRIPCFIKYAGDLVWEKICTQKDLPDKYEDIFTYNYMARFLSLVERWIFKMFDFIWGISSFQKKSLMGIHRVLEEKIISIPNSIYFNELKSEENFPKHADTIEVLTACRFAKWKRVDNAIRAFSKIKNGNVRLRIVGGENPVIENELKQLIHELQLEARVIMTGAVPPPEMGKYYQQADIFLLPTVHEPCSIALIEATAVGLPIVTTTVGGNPDIVIDGKTGFLVEPYDIEGMAEKLQILINNPALREKFSSVGIKAAEWFDLEKNVICFLKLYERLAQLDK